MHAHEIVVAVVKAFLDSVERVAGLGVQCREAEACDRESYLVERQGSLSLKLVNKLPRGGVLRRVERERKRRVGCDGVAGVDGRDGLTHC